MTKVTDLIERLKDDSSDLVYHERHEAAAELLRLSSECEALRKALQTTIDRVEHASDMFHNSQYWHEEDAPDGSGTLWEWVFAPAHTTLQETNGGGK